jgi:hypothetical protein
MLRLLQDSSGAPTPLPRVVAQYFALYSRELDCPSDLILQAQLVHLAKPYVKNDLVAVSELDASSENLAVQITDAGEAVARGEVSNITLNGIDEWVASVHLDSSKGHIWCFSEELNTVRRIQVDGFGTA